MHIHRVPITLDPDFITECVNMCNSFCWFLAESERFQGAKFDICHGHDWLAAKVCVCVCARARVRACMLAHAPPSIHPSIQAVMQCKNMGRNTVATIHSTEYGRCGNVNYGGQSARIRKIEEEMVLAADRIISVCAYVCVMFAV